MGESYKKINRQQFAASAIAVFLITVIFCAFPAAPVFAVACKAVPTSAQVAQLNWGTLQIPAASTTFTVSGTTGATSGTGTLLFGSPGRGQYTISAGSSSESHCNTLTINVAPTNCVAPGCTLGTWTGSYNGTALSGAPPWTGLAMPATGKTLYLGATATYTSAATAGTYAPTFTISANYDALTATSLPQTGAIGFDIPVSIDTVTNLNIGHVKALTAGTYTINTAGVVTPSGGGVVLYGTPNAGSFLIHGSATETISISVGSYTTGGVGGGVSLSAATCSYNGGAPGACTLSTQAAPTSAGKTLLLGVTVTVNASQTANTTATPTFTVTVVYT
jgi:hypothetical protein